jgi:hypothetical protein
MTRFRSTLLVALLVCASASYAGAQELEPGAYTVSPIGVNLFNLGYTFNGGDVAFDPSLPVEDAKSRVHTLNVSLGRSISLFGRSATILVAVPIIRGHIEGLYVGDFTAVDRTGLGDVRIRLGANLYGSPARELAEFRNTVPARTNFSAGLTVITPTGAYDSSRAINIGSNRWSFKPELAVQRSYDAWLFEFYAGAWLFTDNNDYAGGHVRSQKPVGSAQLNARYTFKPGLWLSANVNYYTGGRTAIDGHINLDLQKNSRIGSTLTVPLSPRSSFRLAVSQGAYTTIGGDFLGLSVSYQRAF